MRIVTTGKPHASRVGLRRLLRRGVEAILLLAIAVLMADTFLADGWLVPTVVSSGSMAPALLGPHREARCEACGMPFICDAEDLTVDRLTCPNCDWPGNPIEPRISPGDPLLVDRATFAIRPPQRWEIVVFRCTAHAQTYCVKRVVGLPGEKVEVRDGDVYINGQIARKTLAQQRAMAQLVHDSAYRDPLMPPRWRPEEGNSAWQINAGGRWHRTAANDSAPKSIDWLEYIQTRRVSGSIGAVEETPIRDDDPYNPGTSRRLNDVANLMLVARLRLAGTGELWLRANDARETFELEVPTTSGQIRVKRDDRDVQTARLTRSIDNRDVEIVLSTFDERLLLAIDGRTELSLDYRPSSAPLSPVARPFAVGARGSDLSVERFEVFRDVCYTPPIHPAMSLARQLVPDEYFVLGDNSPISVDSRSWMGGETVPARLLIGRLIEPHRAAF